MRITKKFLSVMLVFLMSLSFVPFSESSITAKATSKTVSEAMAWCESLINQKVGSGQCVALINAYYEYLGVSAVSGNGCDYATNSLPSGWSRVQGGEPQAGDILVYTGAKYGHVAIYAGGSVSYHQNMSGLYVEKKTTWAYYNSWYSSTEGGTKSYWGYIRPDFAGNVSFNAAVDSKISDGETIDKAVSPYYNVAGWAFCSDGSDTTVYWTIDDGAAYAANKNNRQDVADVYGCRLDCGFDFSVPIKDLSLGTHKLSIWVSSSSGSADVYTANFTVTSSDTQLPAISNVGLSNSAESFTVTCALSDNIGVERVDFAVWTDYNGQDDLVCHKGNINTDGKSAWGIINKSEHNEETGYYYVDIYAYDSTGNCVVNGTHKVYLGELIELHGITNEDGSDAYIDISGIPTISGIRMFWFMNYDFDTNYYINIILDGDTVISHAKSESSGYIKYIVDTGALSDGEHTITATLVDSKTTYTASKTFYVNNLIAFTAISSVDNNDWADVSGTPTISGTKKIWFKKESTDTNYYINMYVDGTLVESHKSVDSAGNYSYAIDTTTLTNGEHIFRAELYDSVGYYTATKTIIVSNPQYTLTFNANGGVCSSTSKTVIKNSTYGTLPTPTRSGYSFDGWYTAATGGTKITSSTKVTITANQTLYAHWTCNHSKYTATVTEKATCIEAGTKTYVCDTCSHTYTETISATGHIYENNITEPTCTEGGYTTYVCNICGDTYTANEKEAMGHSYDSSVTEPTCTESGYTTYICSICGDTYTADETAATGHSFGEWAVINDPSCTEEGSMERVCACSTKETQTIDKITHTDSDEDGYCDSCFDITNTQPTEDSENNCSHLCHSENVFMKKFLWPVVRFFIKLFNVNKICTCGEYHY